MADNNGAPRRVANGNLFAGKPQGSSTSHPLSDTKRFAARLRWLRDTYYDRTSSALDTGPSPRLHLKALAVVDCLNAAGYRVSSGAYSEIETGQSFPRKADAFLQAIATCLKLDSDMVHQLRADLVFDIIEERIDHKTALLVVRPMTRFGAAVRYYRERAGLSQLDLAGRIFKQGFSVAPLKADELPPFTNEDELFVLIARIENYSAWPFGDQDRAPFLDACAACLGRDAYPELALAMSEDLLRELMDSSEDKEEH